ncbi:hypothetical protein IB286_00325 [Spongiibacter sp. KMU-158]|uniref:DUF4124 domain-containing protein n=1 Tax=Spongiibacter pelagi TaxID=2760804 RepID=A0A927BXM4_9GAMM|nr:hypothetical protein [Spongiibacter pelagi]MBD2857430.1 hypothetical protein [Spongiibacter pelagi]
MLLRAVKPLFTIVILCAAQALWAEALYYRYPDSRGNVVIDSKVPPEAIPRGYDVIRVDGSVVKTIAPMLSEEEKSELAREREIAAARAEAEEKLRKWDESLLLRYSDVADIEVAKARALKNLKVRISMLDSNLTVLRRQVIQNQQEAAELEREGRSVPEGLTNTIRDLRREISTMEMQINQRSEETVSVAENYEQDKLRFLELQSRLRRVRSN